MTTHPLTAKRLVKLLKSGSSLPSLIETENGNYIVKWNGSGEGTLSSTVDFITTHLAGAFDIPTATPALINIEPEFLEQTQYDEMRDIIAGSFGINFATQFIEEATSYTPQDGEGLEQSLKDRVFLFDVLVLNIDRTLDNPNILLANNQPYFLDFSAAFEIRKAITHRLVTETALLPTLREHPFYKADAEITSFTLETSRLEDIILSVPDEWLPENTKKQNVLEHLEILLENSTETLQRRLAFLKTLPAPDPEAKRLRALGNRQRLGL
jgi:hypothetical protein